MLNVYIFVVKKGNDFVHKTKLRTAMCERMQDRETKQAKEIK